MNRRHWIQTLLPAASALASGQTPAPAPNRDPLPLEQFRPKSMLHRKETRIPRAKFPVIDFHTHITFSEGLKGIERVRFSATPAQLLSVMDHANLRMMVNTTGGGGAGLQQTINALQTPHPDRFIVFTEPSWNRIAEPRYAQWQAAEIEKAHQMGARGLKVLKTLGLNLREQVDRGPLVKVDDRRFDPMWEAVGALGMPVGIHTSDPEAFFLPIDRNNERWEELHAHPDWSFCGKDFPSNLELQEARRRVMRRHPKTQFVCFHVADAENLEYVSQCMDEHHNMHVEIGARIGELGRQPRAARRFIERYQDRVLFGTDATPNAPNYPQQLFGEALYEIYYRFLETEDEYFDYAPAAVPPQGRWQIYGLGLPDTILEKIYNKNAARLLKLTL